MAIFFFLILIIYGIDVRVMQVFRNEEGSILFCFGKSLNKFEMMYLFSLVKYSYKII